jgi:transcriptional regulator with XRE-family HTH domain
MTSLAEIERLRVEAGLSHEALARACDVSVKTWYRWRRGEAAAGPALARMRTVLLRLTGKPDQMDALHRALFGQYWAIAVLVAQQLDVPVQVLRDNPPGNRATANPQWMAAARVREISIYLLNTAHGAPQALIARSLGMSPAAICQTVAKIEERRDSAGEMTLTRIVETLESMVRP